MIKEEVNDGSGAAAADVAAAYCIEHIGKQLRLNQRDKLQEVKPNGIAATHVMDAADAVVGQHRLCGTERDYWETVLAECHRTWLKLYRKAAL